ncbi:MAG: hypothetical protein LBR88_07735 [Zoogloeaceae bacterium]|jgi:hypothetical protein|nr:hypothetical protein [Zoogloeaceae bacterium]
MLRIDFSPGLNTLANATARKADNLSSLTASTAKKEHDSGIAAMRQAVAWIRERVPDFTRARKKNAAARVAHLKQRLEQMQSMLRKAPLPALAKALARELKSLAKELASAAKCLNQGTNGMGQSAIRLPDVGNPGDFSGAETLPVVVDESAVSADSGAEAAAAEAEAAAAAAMASVSAEGAEAASHAQTLDGEPSVTPEARTGIATAQADAREPGGNVANDDKTLLESLKETRRILSEVVALVKILCRQEGKDKESDKMLKDIEREMQTLDKALASEGNDMLYTAAGGLEAW